MSSLAEYPGDAPSSQLLEKRERFVRSASIEKIMRFNTYLCSQNYYIILPAILAWLKSSQTVLQRNAEKTIFFFKSLLFGSLLWLLQRNAKAAGDKFDFFTVKAQDALSLLMALAKARLKVFGFKVTVYATFAAIFAQLTFCVHAMTSVHLPSGFVFLLTCILLICHMCYQQSINQFRKTLEERRCRTGKKNLPNRTEGDGEEKEKNTRPRRSRKSILGNKTISTFNLF